MPLHVSGIKLVNYQDYTEMHGQQNIKNDKASSLCGLVVRVSGYRYRGSGFDLRRYQIF